MLKNKVNANGARQAYQTAQRTETEGSDTGGKSNDKTKTETTKSENNGGTNTEGNGSEKTKDATNTERTITRVQVGDWRADKLSVDISRAAAISLRL